MFGKNGNVAQKMEILVQNLIFRQLQKMTPNLFSFSKDSFSFAILQCSGCNICRTKKNNKISEKKYFIPEK